MGIRIEAFESEWVEYVPDVLDNRLDDEPMTCEIHPLSAGEMRELSRRYGSQLAGKNSASHAVRLLERVISTRVRNIRNCYVGREITTGAELAEHGLSAMIDDIFAAIVDLSHLSKGVKKSSQAPCGSFEADTER